LIQISNESRDQIKGLSAHLVFVEKSKNEWDISSKELDMLKKTKVNVPLTKATSDKIHSYNELYFNPLTGDVKWDIKDLRNIDSVLKDYNLPESARNVVLRDRTSLTNGSYELLLRSNNEQGIKTLYFEKMSALRQASYPLYKDILFSGIFDERLLSFVKTPKISEEKMDGEDVLKIEEINLENGHEAKTTILFLPSIGYRLKSFERRYDGHLVTELIADDYRMINGVPFPFHTSGKQYNISDHKLVAFGERTFEKVEFLNNLDENIFKIHVPKGTVFNDSVLGGKHTQYSEDQDVSIKDLYKDIADKPATEMLTDPNFSKGKSPVK
jgi:hypothetical protein